MEFSMNKKIAVLGCGAIGSSVSADLTSAGYDITVSTNHGVLTLHNGTQSRSWHTQSWGLIDECRHSGRHAAPQVAVCAWRFVR